jgi:hypothetical protein
MQLGSERNKAQRGKEKRLRIKHSYVEREREEKERKKWRKWFFCPLL